jgi:sugar lactone lactonase YvrE
MFAPVGIFSSGSSLYVADSGNNRVTVFTGIPILQNAPQASGLFGQAAFSNTSHNDPDQNSAPGDQRINQPPSGVTNTNFHAPTGVFVTVDGKLFVSDRNNNRVLQFQTSAAVNGGRPDNCARP